VTVWQKAMDGLRKAATRFTMVFSRQSWAPWGTTSLARFDYAGAVGDGRGNSIVIAVVNWVCRNFPEAPLEVVQAKSDGTDEVVRGHALAALLEKPNPFYSGTLLWQATLADWLTDGNGYWLKVRAGSRTPVQLWWVPASLMTPKWPDDGSAFLSHYEYNPNGQPVRIDAADVVHFRNGIDPLNIRKGLSPLRALLREIYSDEEGAAYTASILRNMGVPGVIIAPVAGSTMTAEQAEMCKVLFMQRFTGENRGMPMVPGAPVDVSILSFSPEQMNLRSVRQIPEERISGVFGVAAIVAGLGAGLERGTFANFREAREASYEENIIPSQRLFAADLTTQLLPDFGATTSVRLRFNLRAVRVLQDDQNALMTRAGDGFMKGILTRGEARTLVGQPAEPTDDVFALPVTMELVRRDMEVLDVDADEMDTTQDTEPTLLPERQAAGLLGPGQRKRKTVRATITEQDIREAREWAAGLGIEAFLDATPAPSTNGNGKHG
jgi:HK97 family phage portal protein